MKYYSLKIFYTEPFIFIYTCITNIVKFYVVLTMHIVHLPLLKISDDIFDLK